MATMNPPGSSGQTPAKPEDADKPEEVHKSEGEEPREGEHSTEHAAAAEPKEEPPRPKQRRGFAAMDRAAVRAIASKGGVAAHEKGTAHRFTREEAREAGRKGGRAPHRVRGRKLPASGAGTPSSG